jgi:hypothetical protein
MQLNTYATSSLVELTGTHLLPVCVPVLLHNEGFCNGCITKRGCINQQMCPVMSLFHDCPMIKVESNKKSDFFCNFL